MGSGRLRNAPSFDMTLYTPSLCSPRRRRRTNLGGHSQQNAPPLRATWHGRAVLLDNDSTSADTERFLWTTFCAKRAAARLPHPAAPACITYHRAELDCMPPLLLPCFTSFFWRANLHLPATATLTCLPLAGARNTTICLLSHTRWKNANTAKQTVPHLARDGANSPPQRHGRGLAAPRRVSLFGGFALGLRGSNSTCRAEHRRPAFNVAPSAQRRCQHACAGAPVERQTLRGLFISIYHTSISRLPRINVNLVIICLTARLRFVTTLDGAAALC